MIVLYPSWEIWPRRAALISDSVALSQAPAETTRAWTRSQCVARCACLLLSLRWYQIILLGDRDNACGQFAQCRTRQCSGWDWTRDLQSQVQRPNHSTPPGHTRSGHSGIIKPKMLRFDDWHWAPFRLSKPERCRASKLRLGRCSGVWKRYTTINSTRKCNYDNRSWYKRCNNIVSCEFIWIRRTRDYIWLNVHYWQQVRVGIRF